MKQKLLCIVMTIVLLGSVSAMPVKAASVDFYDVSSFAWYHDAVEAVSDKGWMNGTANNHFSPDESLTRAMLAVILWRMEGCPEVERSLIFKDTTSTAWYADGLSWCVSKGLFAGYPDGRFGPADAVTREQLAAVFYRRANVEPSTGGKTEVRVKNGCIWAADACAWANAKGLFTNALGVLDLCAPASRAEIAYWLAHYDFSAVASSMKEGQFDAMGYLLYTPANAKADMPLIVYLHGGHGKGSELSVLTNTDGFPQYLADGLLGDVPAYVLIPQLPAEQRGWKPAAETVMRLIDKICVENNIDRKRISLTGHSMGGTGTWDLAIAYPGTFSRIAPMSGSVLTTAENCAALKNMPVWAFVGEDDVVVKPESSEQFIDRLSQQNKEAQITVFSKTDHIGVLQKAWLEDGTAVLNWLMK